MKKTKKEITEEQLRRLYLDKKIPMRVLETMYEMSPKTLDGLFKKYGIEKRKKTWFRLNF